MFFPTTQRALSPRVNAHRPRALVSAVRLDNLVNIASTIIRLFHQLSIIQTRAEPEDIMKINQTIYSVRYYMTFIQKPAREL